MKIGFIKRYVFTACIALLSVKVRCNLLVVFCAVCCFTGCQNLFEKKPNIIIIYADDLGYGDLSVLNSESKIQTHALDKLASEGLIMTDAHSSSSVCSPSRYALLTGRYHWRDFHNVAESMGPSLFKKNQYTLPKMLKETGYKTACIGKWHLGWNWESIRRQDLQETEIPLVTDYDWTKEIADGPCNQGFDYYFGDGTINYPPYTWIENRRVKQVPTTMLTKPKVSTLEGEWEVRLGPAIENWDFYNVLPTVTQKAVDYITKQKDSEQPFFLYIALPSPHAPIVPNEEFLGKSNAGSYGDFVSQTDFCVSLILEAIEKIDAKEETMVIFSSDNGPEQYAYDRIKKTGHHSSGLFRGLKRDLYEGGHHVPFIVRWPGSIKAGFVSDSLFSQIDIFKTLAEIVEANLPKGFTHDSYDFSNYWLGNNRDASCLRNEIIHNTRKTRYAVREGDWLYIKGKDGYHTSRPDWTNEYFDYQSSQDTVELFNIKLDIGQKQNISKKEPRRVEIMNRKLMEIQEKETFIE